MRSSCEEVLPRKRPTNGAQRIWGLLRFLANPHFAIKNGFFVFKARAGKYFKIICRFTCVSHVHGVHLHNNLNKRKMETYKGFKIKEVYQSADGRGNYDYFISSESNPQGYVKMKTTLTKVKLFIDTNEEMLNTPKY